MEAFLEDPDLLVIFEEQGEHERAEELAEDATILIIELLNILCHLRLLLTWLAQIIKNESVQRVRGQKRSGLYLKELVLHGRPDDSVYYLYKQIEIKTKEHQLKVMLEELLDEGVEKAMKLFVAGDCAQFLIQYALEDKLTDVGESLVRVVLANCKVDVLPSQEVLHHANQDFEVLVYLLILIILSNRLAILREALEPLQEFDHEASRFSVHNEAIN